MLKEVTFANVMIKYAHLHNQQIMNIHPGNRLLVTIYSLDLNGLVTTLIVSLISLPCPEETNGIIKTVNQSLYNIFLSLLKLDLQ